MTQNFKLQKAKLISGGGIEAHYTSEEREGSEIFQDSLIKKCTKVYHSDLAKAFKNLGPYISQILGITWIKLLTDSGKLKKHEEKAFESLQEICQNAMKAQEERISISGISISGKDDKKSVVIMATMLMFNKRKIAINSPLIDLNGKAFGFEQELARHVDIILEEVEEYLFKGKRAQLDAFAEAEKEGKLIEMKAEKSISGKAIEKAASVKAAI